MHQPEFLLQLVCMTILAWFCQRCTGPLIDHGIHFKTSLITYKALNDLAPQYFSELLLHYSPSCPLRSQTSGHLIIL